jgi:hypothetical protein
MQLLGQFVLDGALHRRAIQHTGHGEALHEPRGQ